jgi:ATP-dependent Clp protease ATP-binding subunit ClpX
MTDTIKCSFCPNTRNDVKKIIAGPDKGEETVYICEECIEVGYRAVSTKTLRKPSSDTPTPHEIKSFLDTYVIEQTVAKEALAVALYNHNKRINNPVVGETTLKKSNVLLIGPSGTGKTLLVSTIAHLLKLPFVQADATTLTSAGYVGEDVDSMVDRLLEKAEGDIELAQRGIIYIDEIDKKSREISSPSTNRDVSGEGVQQALLKLVEGSKVKLSNGSEFDTTNILFIAAGAFVGLDQIIMRSDRNATGIGFTSKVDKPRSLELLLTTTSEDLIEYGMIPEFVGRFPSVVPLSELTAESLIRILTEPKDCLVDQYKSLFSLDDVELLFEEEFLENIAEHAAKQKTGARGLQNLMEKALLRTQFELPHLRSKGATQIIMNKVGKPHVVYTKSKINEHK